MEDTTKATEANAQPIAAEGEGKVVTSTSDDLEAKYKALEAEKARLIGEKDNYKKAYLKEKSKNGDIDDDEEDDEAKMRRIAAETLADSQLATLVQEQDGILKKALKENSELKLAHLNKTNTPPASVGTHSETVAVMDTLVTPEQMAHFKAKGWTDADIQRYKDNLRKKV